MSPLTVVVMTVALCGLVRGQAKYCCFPDQWEGVVGAMTGSSDDEGNSAVTLVNEVLSYDAKMKRIHVDEDIQIGNMSKKYTILQLYNEKVQYIIQNKTCTRATLQPWNNQNCIPDDAVVESSYTIGNKEFINVTEYSWRRYNLQVTISVTDQCVPVFEKQYGQINGANVLSGAGYQQVTPGISDPNIFDVPDVCKQVTETLPHTVYRRSRLF